MGTMMPPFSLLVASYVLLALRTDKGYFPGTPSVYRAIELLIAMGLVKRMAFTFETTSKGEQMAHYLLSQRPASKPLFRAVEAPWRRALLLTDEYYQRKPYQLTEEDKAFISSVW